MELKNQKILLTIIDRGQVAAPVANACSKVLKSKIMTSPFESTIVNKKGVPTGYKTPKNHFCAPNDFVERGFQKCIRKITLQETTVNYFISADSNPYFIVKKKWEKMSQIDRLLVHLTLTSEGKEFEYKVI